MRTILKFPGIWVAGFFCLTVAQANDSQPPASLALSGYWDTRIGTRTQQDPLEAQTSLAETRIRLNLDAAGKKTAFRLKTDLIYDAEAQEHNIDLEAGDGFLDLREASVELKPLPYLNIKAGRQTLSWDLGGLLIINDRFPRDYRSFAIGRDPKYLRAPSDAVKLTLNSQPVNLDIVYTPRFDANRLVDGSRLSFFNESRGQLVGNQSLVKADMPDNWFEDDEISLRLSRNFGGVKAAVYGYRGFWKGTEGIDPVARKATYPQLEVYGASVRGRIGHGGGKLEIGYYDSIDDPDGRSPLIRNSELRFAAGVKQPLSKTLRLGAQFYIERKLDYDAYQQTLPPNRTAEDETRQVFNFRIINLRKQEALKLALVGFYSPTDKDGYLRPRASYRLNKHWAVDGGINWFFGETNQTFFGQLENNSNVYIGARYHFPERSWL